MTRFFSLISAFLVTFIAAPAFADPVDKEYYFQPAATPVMREITHFHNDILMWIASAIVIFVLGLLIYVVLRFNSRANPEPSQTTHNVPLEIVWTLVPVLILLMIAIPSFRLLFFGAVTPEAEMTLKVTGNQWNWSYEYPDDGDISFLSIIDKDKTPRLLRVDNPLYLPVDTVIRIQVTASDVIHSFAVPAFGIKTDGVPGRLNETWVKIDTPGTYYGQCSELCGKDHGFMPIEVHAVSKEEFAEWVVSKGGKMPAPKSADGAAVAAPAPTPSVPADTDKKIQAPEDNGHPVATPKEEAPKETEKK